MSEIQRCGIIDTLQKCGSGSNAHTKL